MQKFDVYNGTDLIFSAHANSPQEFCNQWGYILIYDGPNGMARIRPLAKDEEYTLLYN